ncbi:MAG TPA: hypothetical protein VN240_13840, partial [Propylenella sp.]|nr:hypothetical protein [Propylenella sp.]
IGYYNLRYYVMTTFNWSGTAHNSFLEVLSSTGIPGAALFLAFGLIWLGRVVSLRDGFLLALTPILLIESNLNSILFAPSSAFLLLLVPLAAPLPVLSLAQPAGDPAGPRPVPLQRIQRPRPAEL